MTFVTRGIILPRESDIVTCHKDMTRDNKKMLQKKIKKTRK